MSTAGGSAIEAVSGAIQGATHKITKTMVALLWKSDPHMYQKITIKLTSAEGSALHGATVTLFSDPKTGVTNEEGIVEFENVESGKHKLKIEYQDYVSNQKLVIDEPVSEVTINVTAEFNKKQQWFWQ